MLKEYGANSQASTWVTLGGLNNKTGKPNPTKIEGYYQGTVTGPNTFDPDKVKTTIMLKTSDGKVTGVNASTNLVIKLGDAEKEFKVENGVTPKGANMLITFLGETPTKKGTLKLFSVQFDSEDVVSFDSDIENDESDLGAAYEEDSANEDVVQTAALAAVERKAYVKSLLNGKGKSVKG